MLFLLLGLSVLLPVRGRFVDRYISKKRKIKGLHDNAVNHVLYGALGSINNGTTYFYDEAIVDHFDSSALSEVKYWSQRYYVDDSQWAGEGYPLFVYIGGEGPQGKPTDSLFMYSLAKEHKALMVSLEHRYYGESRPVSDMSLANLEYLSADQALADIAHFLDYFKSSWPSAADSKVITFGGSYPGTLSAWFHLKYPTKAVGAIASSAPVFGEFDFYQYAQVVGQALQDPLVGGSDQCLSLVQNGTTALVNYIQSTGSFSGLPDALQPCTSNVLNSTLDLSTYYSSIYGNFQGVVQYNLEGSSPTVATLCATITNQSDPLLALAAATAIFEDDDEHCVESSFQLNYIDAYLSNISFSAPDCDLDCTSDRQWIYQSCNSFGFFQTATSAGVQTPFDAFDLLNATTAGIAVCAAAFGDIGYSGPRRAGEDSDLASNENFGARFFLTANVTFVNGNLDPWHSLSIVNATDPFYEAGTDAPQVLSPSVDIVELNGTAHCRDMYAPDAFKAIGINDTASVMWAHTRISDNVKRYLS